MIGMRMLMPNSMGFHYQTSNAPKMAAYCSSWINVIRQPMHWSNDIRLD